MPGPTLALECPIRPNLDEGVEWNVVKGIYEKTLGGLPDRFKIYAYPPEEG